MSTISSTQEAYEALCAGEFFQVGGRFINPSDIVEVDPNGGQNPTFYLENGRTVQHNRFTKGDVGDYLADALEYATRGQAQAQALKPGFTHLLYGGGFNQVLDTDLAPTGTNVTHPFYVDDEGDIYGKSGSNSQVIEVGSIFGGSVQKIDVSSLSTANIGYAYPHPTKTEIWFTWYDSGVQVGKMNEDGSNKTLVISASVGGDGPFRIFPDKGVLFVVSNASLTRVQLDGSTATELYSGSPGTGSDGDIAINTDEEIIFHSFSGTSSINMYDYTGTRIDRTRAQNASGDTAGMAWSKEKERLYVLMSTGELEILSDEIAEKSFGIAATFNSCTLAYGNFATVLSTI
jgi:hypothetical protein